MHLTIAPSLAPAAAPAFTSEILPKVRTAPGFVAGYWVDPVDGQGFGFLLFETYELALTAGDCLAGPRSKEFRGPMFDAWQSQYLTTCDKARDQKTRYET